MATTATTPAHAGGTRKTSWLPLVAVAATTLLLAAVYLLMQGRVVEVPERTPMRFMLPQGFSGPVKVYFSVEGAPALPEAEGFIIVAIPPSGIALTSSEPLYGSALDQFTRTNADGVAETLGYHYIRDRKHGITGDGKEYFLRPEELAQRDTELVRHGIVNKEDGTPRYGVPYVLFSIRDDF